MSIIVSRISPLRTIVGVRTVTSTAALATSLVALRLPASPERPNATRVPRRMIEAGLAWRARPRCGSR